MTELIPLFSYLERLNVLKFSVRDLESAGIYEPTTDGQERATFLKVVKKNTFKNNEKQNQIEEEGGEEEEKKESDEIKVEYV